MAEQISHKMPESLRRVGRGEYEVKGTALRIVQDADSGKWSVQGHSDDLGAFASRGAALGKLHELGLIPAQPVEQKPEAEAKPEPAKDEAKAQEPKQEPAKRPPPARKPRAKAAAKV